MIFTRPHTHKDTSSKRNNIPVNGDPPLILHFVFICLFITVAGTAIITVTDIIILIFTKIVSYEIFILSAFLKCSILMLYVLQKMYCSL